jgi:hypothetical protein
LRNYSIHIGASGRRGETRALERLTEALRHSSKSEFV